MIGDNNSQDNSVEILTENYKNEVKLLKLNKNYGFALGNNKVINHSKE